MFLKWSSLEKKDPKNVHKRLQQLVLMMAKSEKPLSANDLLTALNKPTTRFARGSQHDAYEVLDCILKKVQDPSLDAMSAVSERCWI